MHADGQAARAGIEVIAAHRTLAPGVEAALAVQRQQVRGDRRAAPQQRQ